MICLITRFRSRGTRIKSLLTRTGQGTVYITKFHPILSNFYQGDLRPHVFVRTFTIYCNVLHKSDLVTYTIVIRADDCAIISPHRVGELTVGSVQVHGFNTQGENIADNGGLRAALHAYRLQARRAAPVARRASLPGLPRLKPDQLFFLGFAQVTDYTIRA